MEMSQQLSGVEKTFDSPLDAVNHIVDNLLLEKTTCFDVDLNSVGQMLRNVVCVKGILLKEGSWVMVWKTVLVMFGICFIVLASLSRRPSAIVFPPENHNG